MEKQTIIIDFETRSEVDLRKVGPWVYAEHPSTEILCMAYKFGDALTKIHIPEKFLSQDILTSEELKGDIKDFSKMAKSVLDYDFIFEAHNAEFERAIWYFICHKRWGWPDIPIHLWRCSAAKAAALSMPRSLDALGSVLNLPVPKDGEGRKIMLKTCKPRPPRKAERIDWLSNQFPRLEKKTIANEKILLQQAGELMPILWYENPDELIKLFKYCITDVEVEYYASKKLRKLSSKEQQLWFLDQKINTRGIQIDIPNVKKAIGIINDHEDKALKELEDLTCGRVNSVRQIAATKDWLATRGVQLDNLQKATVEEALNKEIKLITKIKYTNIKDEKDTFEKIQDNKSIRCESARRVLEIRQSLGKSSTSKLKTMLESSNADGRARGLLMYHGASTGRWSGKRIQPQNLPRPEFSDTEVCVDAFDNPKLIEALWGDPMKALASCTRNMIVSKEGKDFICGDFSSIEARDLAYFAREDIVLDAFRRGDDVYKLAATAIYNVPYDRVTKAHRQIGKVAVLALGYQGAVGAFQQMAKGYGVDISDEAAKEIVDAWRAKNTKITDFWKENEYAVTRVLKTGKTVSVSNDRIFWGLHDGYLFCKLPSGRLMAYYKPELKQIKAPWGMKEGITYMGSDSVTRKWVRIHTYGGKLVENIIQAVARDMLVEAMFRVEEAGYKIVLTVHDEILCEVPEGFGSVEEFEAIMSVPPKWAEDCPINAEAWRGKRYRK